MQIRTSKNTCTHFGHKNKAYNFIPQTTKSILDYGCGKYDDNENYCKNLDILWLGYDPYWKDENYNNLNLDYVKNFGIDCIICSNVLNTIDDIDTILSILQCIYDLAKENTTIIFSCYKGNGKGIGKETKKDCWQRNENYKIWTPRLEQFFNIIKRDDDVYICEKKY